MSMPDAPLRDLRDEATTLFVGHGAVVGVGVAANQGLVVLTSRPDPDNEAAIRQWARSRTVAVEVVLAGPFRAASQNPV